jgi:hypothetical protein
LKSSIVSGNHNRYPNFKEINRCIHRFNYTNIYKNIYIYIYIYHQSKEIDMEFEYK